ncbi:type 4a pilus biogenesis protein PilO [Photobacterium galatheae]|uniref:Pilus assembly protein PilO n=1 Tax=Photobacterium galatheae TaxID=1654360 RepID=A0A066RSD6_9GAMM|nr:type 4a pilus biogenesis protein PilO [Photobacterium galatheae]KDM90602.1 hypothetical protein EA58_15945 [Photobacterium galatheae]MCM0150703.1 type 4a pilus biogenesis protein PilO [Photobacterium galatheae]
MTDWRDLTVETLPDWPLRYQVVACLLAHVVVLTLGQWWLLSPLQVQRSQLTLQVSALEGQVRHQQVKADSLPELQAQTQQLQAEYRQQQRRLPGAAEWMTVLHDIQSAGTRSGVQLQGLKWQKSQVHEAFVIQPVQFELSGSYVAIGQFFAMLAAKQWLLVVETLEIQPDAQVPGLLKAQGLAQLYQAANAGLPESLRRENLRRENIGSENIGSENLGRESLDGESLGRDSIARDSDSAFGGIQ